MPDLTQRMIIEAITKGFDQISKDLTGVSGGLDDVQDSVKQNNNRWTELAGKISVARQAFDTVAAGAQKAYQFVGEGAQLEFARSQFDNLAMSIGTTSDALLNQLGAATKGMMSNADMIASASELISLGLAKDEESVIRLATTVSTLSLDMQQVIMTFSNNSKMRLDALGLSVEDVDNKVAALEAQGFQGDAFDEAVLIALEEKMTLLGDASQTTAGQMQILEASFANVSNSAKQSAAQIAGPMISALAKNTQAQEQLDDAYKRGLITWREWNAATQKLSGDVEQNTDVFERYNLVLAENGQLVATGTQARYELGKAIKGEAEALNEIQTAISSTIRPNEELNDKFAQQSNLLDENATALAKSRAELAQLQKDAAASGNAFVGATSGVGGFTSAITGAVTEAGNLLTPLQEIQNMLDQTAAQEAYADSTARINETWQEAQNIAIEEKLTGVYRGLEDTGTQADAAAGEVETYISRLGEVPDEVQTQLTLRYSVVGGPGGDIGEAGDPTRYAPGSAGNQGEGNTRRYYDEDFNPLNKYADGGIVPGPIGAPQLAIVHGGETIIPPGQNSLSVTQNFYGSSPDTMQQAKDGLLDAAREIGLVGFN